jgi:hypothetical protein
MKKNDLLKQIAERAYNVEFGACRNFATYDAVTKIPDLITVLSLIIGILGLVFNCLTVKWLSASILILSIIGLYVSRFTENTDKYSATGEQLTQVYYDLKDLYMSAKSEQDDVDEDNVNKYKEICNTANKLNISRQMYFSDIRANIKFFERDDIKWIDAELHFKFWRDKFPRSLKHLLNGIIIAIILIVIIYYIKGICSQVSM